MSNCSHFQLLLSMAQDGEATAAQQARVEEHLRECAPCRQASVSLHGLSRALQAYEPPAPTPPAARPPALRQTVLASLLAAAWLGTSFSPLFWPGYLAWLIWTWRRARPLAAEYPGRPGALEHVLAPIWLPLGVLSTGMLLVSLSDHGIPAWIWWLATLALWLGPVACVARQGAGGFRPARPSYPMPVLLLDTSALGLAIYLFSFLGWSAPLTDPSGHWLYSCEWLNASQGWLRHHPWVLAVLALLWWALVRTPLATAAELWQGSRHRWVVNALAGLPLGLTASVLLVYQADGSRGFSVIWPIAPLERLPLCLALASLAGILLGLRRERRPHPDRLAVLRSRLAAGSLGLVLALLGLMLGLAWLFPGVPEPLMPRLYSTPPLQGPIPEWLRETSLRLDGPEKAKAGKVFLKHYAQLAPEAVNPEMKLKLAACLEQLAEDRRDLGLYLEANRWWPQHFARPFADFLAASRLSGAECRRVLESWDGFPEPDPLPWADYNFQEWRDGLLASPLPDVYMNFERQVGSLWYVRFRGALAHGRSLPRAEEIKERYPTAPLSYRMAENLLESYAARVSDWVAAEKVVLLAALQLYRAQHGEFPPSLSEISDFLQHSPGHNLGHLGRFHYARSAPDRFSLVFQER